METKKHGIWYRLSLVGLGKEKNDFLENFSNLLNSWMSVADAMDFVSEEVHNKTLKKIVQWMAFDIKAGMPLSEVMGNTELFSPHMLTLINIGQESWRLNENITILVSEEKKSQELRGKIRSALMYPMFVLALVLIVGIGISWFILPKLATVFGGLNLEIPPITQAIINFWLFLEKNGLIAVPLFFLWLGLLFYFMFSYPKTRFIGEFFLFHIPGIKRLMKESSLAQFGFLLGTLLSAGLSPLDSIDSLVKSTQISRYRKLYQHVLATLADGFSFRQSFKSYPHIEKLFPASIQQIVVSGEQSGTLPETLLRLGENYERRIEATTKDLSVMLEPIMLVIVWAGVVGLALSVILPIYDLIGSLR